MTKVVDNATAPAAAEKGKPGEHWDFVSRVLKCATENRYWKHEVRQEGGRQLVKP